MELTSDN